MGKTIGLRSVLMALIVVLLVATQTACDDWKGIDASEVTRLINAQTTPIKEQATKDKAEILQAIKELGERLDKDIEDLIEDMPDAAAATINVNDGDPTPEEQLIAAIPGFAIGAAEMTDAERLAAATGVVIGATEMTDAERLVVATGVTITDPDPPR